MITVWLQCDYVENELSLFLRNPDTFFDAFYCCRWNLFFRSCKTFSTTLICLMMIPKKSHFSFKETKISYVIVWMTLAIHRSVAKTQKISIQIIIAYEKICDYFCAGGRSKKMLSTYKRWQNDFIFSKYFSKKISKKIIIFFEFFWNIFLENISDGLS